MNKFIKFLLNVQIIYIIISRLRFVGLNILGEKKRLLRELLISSFRNLLIIDLEFQLPLCKAQSSKITFSDYAIFEDDQILFSSNHPIHLSMIFFSDICWKLFMSKINSNIFHSCVKIATFDVWNKILGSHRF